MSAERVTRYVLKLLQLLFSIYLVSALFLTGPHWMLIAACIAVPLFGIYLMTKSPDQAKHPVPYVMYKAIAKGKSWQRVDVAICLTMTIVCFGFSTILFIGYFKVYPSSPYFLHAAIAALILSILYCLNALLTTRQLQSGTIDFANDTLFATLTSKNGPLSVDTSYGNETTAPASNNTTYNILQSRGGALQQQNESSQINRARVLPTEDSSDENFRIELNDTLKTIEFPSDTDEKSRANLSANSNLWYYESSGKREFYKWSSNESNTLKDQPNMSSSVRMNPDPARVNSDGLDARERYIKAKQHRDFMDPSGSLSWNKRQAYSANLHKNMENFNERFVASGHSSGSESELRSPETRHLNSSLVLENYKTSTQPYTRRPIIPAFSTGTNNRRVSESSSVAESTSSMDVQLREKPTSILKPMVQKREESPMREKRFETSYQASTSYSPRSQHTETPDKNPDTYDEIPSSTSFVARIHPDEDSTYSVIVTPRPYKPHFESRDEKPPTLRFLPASPKECEVGPASSTSSYEEVSREDSPDCDKSTTLVFFRGGMKNTNSTKIKPNPIEDDKQTTATDSSLASTIRMDDYDSRYFSNDDKEVQATLAPIVNSNTEPIPSIASNIDSNRENEMRVGENLQRTSSRVRKLTGQKRGFDVMIRPKSTQSHSDTNGKNDSNLPNSPTQI